MGQPRGPPRGGVGVRHVDEVSAKSVRSAAADYVRAPRDTAFRALTLDVLRFEGDRLGEITTFGPTLFAAFGLPPEL